MGRVYLAHQLALDTPRAIKVIGSRYDADDAARARFRREAQVLSRLHHNHSIQVLDFGALDDGRLFIVMEYIDGSDLAKLIETSGPRIPPTGHRRKKSHFTSKDSRAHLPWSRPGQLTRSSATWRSTKQRKFGLSMFSSQVLGNIQILLANIQEMLRAYQRASRGR